jgi:5-dehydro-2-deoxygluconokinase
VTYDLITVGRANMDLFSLDIGAPFEKVRRFEAMVGGSPTNIAIGTTRLGLRSIAFSGVGNDRVGDLLLDYLTAEGVVTDWVFRIPEKLSSIALLGVQPPDHFPLMFYRADPADIHLTVGQASALPYAETTAILLSGNAFSRGTCADAARTCGELARRHGLVVFMDLDLRPTEWTTPGSYGTAMRSLLSSVDVVIGTDDELWAALNEDESQQLEAARQNHRLDALLDRFSADGVVFVRKRGSIGATLYGLAGSPVQVDGFSIDVVNTVGAGDAFASGLITRRLRGDDWEQAVRYANACGAIEVSRHGCASALPYPHEVEDFLEAQLGPHHG